MAQILCPVLVGRSGPVDALAAATARTAAGRGGFLGLVGEAGSGKSRLLREAVARAQVSGMAVLSGRAVDEPGGSPYRSLIEAVLGGLRRYGEPDDPAIRPFRAALGTFVPGWGDGLVLSGPVLGEGLIRLAAALGSGRGTLLVLEDLHWSDPETMDVVDYLADAVEDRPVLCLVSARPGRRADRLSDAVARGTGAMVKLPALSSADVSAMAGACLGVDALPATLPALLDRADGVPLLVEELLATAVEAGTLRRGEGPGGGWTYRADAVAPVPRTVADTVSARTRRLDPDTLDVLRFAALLGRRFDWTLLAPALGRTPDAVLASLRACADAQLLVLQAGDFRFRHALTCDAVLDQMVPLERAVAARSVLAAAGPDGPGESAATLLRLAGEPEAAARALLDAARRALSSGALGSAQAWLEQARELATTDARLAADVDEVLLGVAAVAGDADRAAMLAEALDSALLALGESDGRRSGVHLQVARAALAAGRGAPAADRARAARRLAGTRAALIRVDVVAAEAALLRGLVAEAEDLARSVLRSDPDVATSCAALEVLGRAVRHRSVLDAAAVFEQQLAAATAPQWRLRALHQLGTVELLTTMRTDRLDEARAAAISIGALATAATIDLQTAGNLASGFRVRESLDTARRCVHLARRLRLGILPDALVTEAGAHAVAGDREPMAALVREALAHDVDDELRSMAIARCDAIAALLDEDRAAAVDHFDRAMALVLDRPATTVRPYFGLWALLHCLEDADGATACAEVRARSGRVGVVDGLVDLGEAILHGRGSRPHDAAQAVSRSQARLAPYGPRFAGYHQLSRRLVADAALADGWGDPIAWATEASEFFRDTGHRAVEGACRALLARAGVPVPRRFHGHARVPPELRGLGVTDREVDVLLLVAEGLPHREIGARLFISTRTVDKHVERLRAKTGATDRDALRAVATRFRASAT